MKEDLREEIAKIIREHFDCGTLTYQGEAHRISDQILSVIQSHLDAQLEQARKGKPEIVCLCGSTRFMEQFFNTGWDETMKGHIVLSVGVNLKARTPDGGHVGELMGNEVKEMLDELHKRKIDLADRVIVLNVGGYIGDSTRSEIEYAKAHGKPITYLEILKEGVNEMP